MELGQTLGAVGKQDAVQKGKAAACQSQGGTPYYFLLGEAVTQVHV